MAAKPEVLVEMHVGVLEADVEHIRSGVSEMKTDIRKLRQEEVRPDTKIGSVEQRLSIRLDDLDRRLSGKIDGVDQRLSGRNAHQKNSASDSAISPSY